MKLALRGVGGALGALIVGLLSLAAMLLSPWRTGRLLREVSIPRFREHLLRTSLTVLGIALGVAFLVAVLLVDRSIVKSFAATIDDISGKVDLEVTGPSGGFPDEAAMDAVRAVKGVYKCAPVLQETAPIRFPAGSPLHEVRNERLLMLGVDFLDGDDEFFRDLDSKELLEIKRNPIEFLNSKTNIIVSQQLADRFGFKLHDKIPLVTPSGLKEFDIWGFVEPRAVGRAFGGSVAVMFYGSMQVAFDHGDNIHRIDVAVAKSADPADVRVRLLAALGKDFEVGRPDRRQGRIQQMIASLSAGLTMGSLIALLVGMFLVYNTMSISVVQRRREISVFRALGTTRRQVVALFALEAALFGLVGSAVGIGLGILLARGSVDGMSKAVTETYIDVAASGVTIDLTTIGRALLLGVVGSVLSSLLPATQAARASPAAALRPAALASGVSRGRRLLVTDLPGAALLIAAAALLAWGPVQMASLACLAILLGTVLLAPRAILLTQALLRGPAGALLGVSGRIAADNLSRDLGRVAITAGALMVGVVMATAFGAFIGSFTTSVFDWVEQSVPADLHVTSAAKLGGVKDVPMVDALKAPIQAIPGVELVERVRVIDEEFRGHTIKLGSTDGDVYAQRATSTFLEGTRDEAYAGFRSGDAIVSENFAKRYDVHLHGKLELQAKVGPRTFNVAGVIVDYTSDLGTVFLDRKVFVDDWKDDRVDIYRVYAKPGADLVALKNAIYEGFGAKYDLTVLTNHEYRREVQNLLNQVFGIMNALVLVAILIAALGVVNALLASVLDRTREVGVLRAVGMRRREVRRMVMTEAGLIGVAGTVSGVVAGLVLGWVLVAYLNFLQSGWHVPFRPSWGSIAAAGAWVIGVSVVAGWYPAREASRLPVHEALEYE